MVIMLTSRALRKTTNLTIISSLCVKLWISIPANKHFISTSSSNPPHPSLASNLSSNIRNRRLNEARRLFDQIPAPTVYHYTMMIAAYSRSRRIDEALHLFHKMPLRDTASWNSIIKGCLENQQLDLATKLFDEIPNKNVISWTTMLSGCAKFGKLDTAEDLFRKMPLRDSAAWNSMVSGYCSNGRIKEAWGLFNEMPCRNVISWTTMISGLDQCGRSYEAVILFRDMCAQDVEATSNTYACVLTACANICALQYGIQLHSRLVKLGFLSDSFISTTLITFYANCMEIENSLKVFRQDLCTNVVTWTALLTGYSLNNKNEEALKLFHEMLSAGVMPNQSTFTSALNSCCKLDAYDVGKELHAVITKFGLDSDAFVGNSLIVMYTKSGCIDDGIAIFNNIGTKNIVSWNTIIVGCAQNGRGLSSLEFFDRMKYDGIPPDEITYVGVLTACSHSRMLEKGKHVFDLLNHDQSVDMNLEHYSCMVDVLCRSGKLEEALMFIRNLPMKPSFAIWMALLNACQMHSNLEIANIAARHILNSEPKNSAVYVQLSNLYASAGWWDEVSEIRNVMKEQGYVKQLGSSCAYS